MSRNVTAVYASYQLAVRHIDELVRSGISPSAIHVKTTPQGVQVVVEAPEDRAAEAERTLASPD